MFLALLIARFIIIDGIEDIEFLKEFCDDYEEFYELTQTVRIKQTLADIDVTLGQIGTFLNLIKNKKCSILVGLGAQKYSDGADVLRAIDAIGALLGLFGKEGSGVSFLSNSMNGIKSPFATIKKETPKATCNFENYNLVFIQGANPLGSMPNSSKVKSSLEKSEFVIYFGLYENETSKLANLVIPAKTFLGKNDIRFSYGSNEAFLMPKVRDEDFGISEYEFSSFLAKELSLELKNEDEYIEYFKSFTTTCSDSLVVKNRAKIPYEDDIEFEFLDEIDSELNLDEKLFLLTSKSKKSLNTQFQIDEFAYINSSHNIKDMSLIKVISSVGESILHVKIDENLRDDCILIYAGNPKVNYLTPSKLSYDGKNAVFQELKVDVSIDVTH
ncbi:MAG: molybdopterin-dependent oxidoreductase [Campylobacterota bacterium]|nr:molybdopterin-dependent oxidoreductase [Campylobacterota bacterium]